MENREKARKSIIHHVRKMENDCVLRSICFIIGDYAVCEDGAERASVIAKILFNVVNCSDMQNLGMIFALTRAFAESEVEESEEQNGTKN